MDLQTCGLEVPAAVLRRWRIRQALPAGDHEPQLDRIGAELDALADPRLLSAAQVSSNLIKLQELSNRIDALRDHTAAAAKDAGHPRELHAGSPGTLVAAASTHNPGYGSAALRRAQLLQRLPRVDQAYRGGRISKAHVDVIREACDKIDGFAGLEQFVVDLAAQVEPGGLARVLNDLIMADLGPEDFEKQYQKSRRRRGLNISQDGPDLVLRGRLDSVQAQILLDAINPAMNADPVAGDTRTKDQKHADVVVDLIGKGAGSTRPGGVSGVTVLVDVDHLQDGQGATFEDGTPIPESAWPGLTDTAVVFYLFGRRVEGTFLPLAVAREKRFATPAQCKALAARDRGCLKCGAKPRQCQAHHIIGWAAGGTTDISNMTLLCSSCHAALHAGYYTITMINDIPEITDLWPGRTPP